MHHQPPDYRRRYANPGPTRRAHLRLAALACAVLTVVPVGLVALPATAAAAATPPTLVTLTFDDSNVDQLGAAQTMSGKGLVGTFYTVSGFVDAPGYLTQANLHTIAAAGNEIAGHTVTHPDLATLSNAESQRQICNDRATLTSWGFAVTSFAYPFASASAANEQVAQGCGYNSARGLGDVESRFGCTGCGYAETLPPDDFYYTKALDEVDSTWTMADLQSTVVNAENNGGGWVQLTFHHVCTGCDALSVTPALFDQFTTWLAGRAATTNTVVRTVQQVLGGAAKPLVAAPVVPAPAPGVNGIHNPSLETAGTTTLPQCWTAGGYGTNTPSFTTTTTTAAAHTGSKAETLTVSGYASGDAKLLPTLDLGECAPTVTPGHTYSLRTWYRASSVTQFAVYLRNSIGTWSYWTSSPWYAPATGWTAAVWAAPAIPAGATGISFGLNVFTNGTLSTDDYELYDTTGAPAAPGVAAHTARGR